MEQEIKLIIEQHIEELKNMFGVDDVFVEIQEDPTKVIPETGAGGYTPDSHQIFFYYDSTNLNFKENIANEVKSTITHEFHHVIRNRTYNWKEDTLLGAMITEGLADHFDIEINNTNIKPWSKALNQEELDLMIKKSQEELYSKTYNHIDWFFGSQERNIPKWTGYSIGFKLVEDYIKKTNKKPSELVGEPAENFLK